MTIKVALPPTARLATTSSIEFSDDLTAYELIWRILEAIQGDVMRDALDGVRYLGARRTIEDDREAELAHRRLMKEARIHDALEDDRARREANDE